MTTMNLRFAIMAQTVLNLVVLGNVALTATTPLAEDKVKVLYHAEGKDPEVAK